MFFLNERLIAAFLSIVAFFVSFFASLYFKVSLQSALLRSSICAFIFLFVGMLFGNAIKILIVEAFVTQKYKKRKKEDTSSDEGSKSSTD